ncbi:radical SAM protein [Micromonospora craterilacus]|uniref:Radical SAM protein n=1 Tax=Micromonospora craterilacus TaxID=1655439 RepID=A0A2W2DZR9_9ACTN|nr:Rv2578c family radical SAM protein [Micromonospora craterilacus]PZG15571.1 radical SAM protein [Micromonospora craterilacus]
MRWDNLAAPPVEEVPGRAAPATPPLPLALPGAVVRTFDTPGFAGMTFHEVRAKSIISKVPGASRVPFEWTINPYRGCSHGCVYCFARNTHTYLDLDAGADFDRQVIVKVNAGELVRRELAAPRWRGGHVAMGTNVDCYQRAEGRYRLMPSIIEALRDFANPFSILTKGTLILRDLPLLRQAAQVTRVGVSFSVGFLDEQLWRSVEPGTPSPSRRLAAVRQFTDAGFEVGVLMAPILPGLSDSDESIEATVAAIAAAGATSVTPLPLHLRPGAREWYARWLAREYPHLVPRYRELFRSGAYAPQSYQRELTARARIAARRHGLCRPAGDDHRQQPQPPAPPPEQLSLI